MNSLYLGLHLLLLLMSNISPELHFRNHAELHFRNHAEPISEIISELHFQINCKIRYNHYYFCTPPFVSLLPTTINQVSENCCFIFLEARRQNEKCLPFYFSDRSDIPTILNLPPASLPPIIHFLFPPILFVTVSFSLFRSIIIYIVFVYILF